MAPSSTSRAAPELGLDQLGVDEAARAEVHSVLLLALAPERHADVADAHRLGHLRAPALFQLRAKGRLAAAGLAGHEDALDARSGEIEVLCQVRGVRRRQHHGLGLEERHGANETLGVPGSNRDVRQSDALEGGERRAGDEGPGVVGGDDALAGRDARGRIAPCRCRDPVVEVAGSQRDVAGRAGRSARRVDPNDLRRRRAEMRADRVAGRARLLQLALVRERQLGDLGEAASVPAPASFSR